MTTGQLDNLQGTERVLLSYYSGRNPEVSGSILFPVYGDGMSE